MTTKNTKTPVKSREKFETVGRFRISRHDARNWLLEELIPGQKNPFTGLPGQDKWIFVGFYGQLKDVATCLLNKSIVLPDGITGQQILEAIQQAEKCILDSLLVASQTHHNSLHGAIEINLDSEGSSLESPHKRLQ